MEHCFIISSNLTFVNTTARFVSKHSYIKSIKILLRNAQYSDSIELHKCLSEKLNSIQFTYLRESVFIVDEYLNLNRCNAINHKVDPEVFWSRMILAFPEMEFLFLNKLTADSRTVIDWIENESKKEKDAAFGSLFDHGCVRNRLRKNINRGLPIRDKFSRIIEDELSYAYFHGYIAYKRNHLCKLYTTLNHLEKESKTDETVQLQIQDLSLGFVDKREDVHLLDMSKRYKELPFLKNVETDRDFIITSGQEHKKVKAKYIFIDKIKKTQKIIGILTGNKAILVREKIYFIWLNDGENSVKECDYCELKNHDLNYKVEQIYKPTKGMYDIEKKLQLISTPPTLQSDVIERKNGHSAPGVLAFIAESLIARSQHILDNAKQITDAVHAATLALEAKELLNGLTPTLALQAFVLQQKAEVTAECLFIGTEYNIKLKPRFKNIKGEVEFIALRFAESERERTQLNVQLKIAETLSGIYGNYKQFEEELECLNKARSLSFKLSNKAFVPFLMLLSWAMNSLKNFGWVLLGMQIIFAFCYYLLSRDYVNSNEITMINSLVASSKYFFTSETTTTFEMVFQCHELSGNIIRTFQGVCSLSSLSIFMALIYLRFSRK